MSARCCTVPRVFAAPFDLDAICAVVEKPSSTVRGVLARLVDWNLITLRTGTPSSYRVLETIRQYVAELPDVELDVLRTEHLNWCERKLSALLAMAPGDENWCVRGGGRRARRRPGGPGMGRRPRPRRRGPATFARQTR